MEMLEPIPTPPAPTVRAHEQQQRKRPQEEESESREKPAYAASSDESPQIAPDDHRGYCAARRTNPIRPPRCPQNENQQRREIQNDERGCDRAADFFRGAPRQSAYEEEAGSETADGHQQQKRDDLQREHGP